MKVGPFAPLGPGLRIDAATHRAPLAWGAASYCAEGAEGAEGAEAVRVASGYVTTHAARLDSPRFVARQFPLGSGAVERTCTALSAARAGRRDALARDRPPSHGQLARRGPLRPLGQLLADPAPAALPLPARPPPSAPSRSPPGDYSCPSPVHTADHLPADCSTRRLPARSVASSAPHAVASPTPLPPTTRSLRVTSLFWGTPPCAGAR